MRQRTILWLLFTGILCSSGTAQTFEFQGKAKRNHQSQPGLWHSEYPVRWVRRDAYRVTYTMPFLGEEIVSGVAFEPTDLDPRVHTPACLHARNHFCAK